LFGGLLIPIYAGPPAICFFLFLYVPMILDDDALAWGLRLRKTLLVLLGAVSLGVCLQFMSVWLLA